MLGKLKTMLNGAKEHRGAIGFACGFGAGVGVVGYKYWKTVQMCDAFTKSTLLKYDEMNTRIKGYVAQWRETFDALENEYEAKFRAQDEFYRKEADKFNALCNRRVELARCAAEENAMKRYEELLRREKEKDTKMEKKEEKDTQKDSQKNSQKSEPSLSEAVGATPTEQVE